MNSIFCCLGDCNQEECHHCFPVENCSMNHDYCLKMVVVQKYLLKKY